jgi:hypothetical protein
MKALALECLAVGTVKFRKRISDVTTRGPVLYWGMNSRLFLALILAGAGGVACTAVARGNETRTAEKTPPVLKQGMTSDEVLATFGKPADVRPMQSPAGKAEVWTYRRVYRRDTGQVATGVTEVPAFVWIGGPLGSTPELTYSIRTVTIYQVTSLLMFNGQVVSAKQWFERDAGSYQ